jgi:hypothetical protein
MPNLPATWARPLSKNLRNPRACLICPDTGSTIALRRPKTAFSSKHKAMSYHRRAQLYLKRIAKVYEIVPEVEFLEGRIWVSGKINNLRAAASGAVPRLGATELRGTDGDTELASDSANNLAKLEIREALSTCQ